MRIDRPVIRVRIPPLLDLTTYLSVVVMSFLGISGLSSLRSQLIALGLCLTFGLLYRFVFRTGRYENNPSLYFGAQALVLTLIFLLGSSSTDSFNFLALILSIHAALVLSERAAAMWIAIFYGIVSAVVLLTRGTQGLFAILFYLVAYIVCGFFGYILRQAEVARDRNQQLLEELQSTQRRLQELAVLEERNRLARELHDSVKQQVFSISMQLGAARSALDEGDAAFPSVAEAERLAKQAATELTTLIHQLRPPGLERKNLASALGDHLEEWSRRNDIQTSFNVEGEPAMNADAEGVLFRVAQEALANAARHSHASQVKVELVNGGGEATLSIEDDGIGFNQDLVAKGVGLDSMKERMQAAGGELTVFSEPRGGTRVVAHLRRPK